MGTNCASLLTDLFLYSYESEFLLKLVKDKKIHEARAFNFTYKYVIDEELQHTDHLFLGVECFTFLNFVWKICGIVAQHILSHSFYDWKLYELLLLSGFLICHAVGWYIEWGILFQQVVGIPMGTNCAPLLADLFLYSYESEFLLKLVKDKALWIVSFKRVFNLSCGRVVYRVEKSKVWWRIHERKILI
jgi:hypothetical protein